MGGTCGNNIPVGTCTIVVTYNPTSTGAMSDTININFNDGAINQVATQALSGTGLAPAALSVSDGDTYSFGSKVLGLLQIKRSP